MPLTYKDYLGSNWTIASVQALILDMVRAAIAFRLHVKFHNQLDEYEQASTFNSYRHSALVGRGLPCPRPSRERGAEAERQGF